MQYYYYINKCSILYLFFNAIVYVYNKTVCLMTSHVSLVL